MEYVERNSTPTPKKEFCLTGWGVGGRGLILFWELNGFRYVAPLNKTEFCFKVKCNALRQNNEKGFFTNYPQLHNAITANFVSLRKPLVSRKPQYKDIYRRIIEMPHHAHTFQVNRCLKVHRAHLKLPLPISWLQKRWYSVSVSASVSIF